MGAKTKTTPRRIEARVDQPLALPAGPETAADVEIVASAASEPGCTPGETVTRFERELDALDGAIATDETELRDRERQHGAATDLETARDIEEKIATLETRLRRRRGDRIALNERLEQARAQAAEAARAPHRERLAQLTERELPRQVDEYKRTLALLANQARGIANSLHAIAEAANGCTHRRRAELRHPDAAGMGRGEPGHPALIFSPLGALFEVSREIVDTRRLLGVDALDRLVVHVQTLVGGDQ
jgi:hypothetical protein